MNIALSMLFERFSRCIVMTAELADLYGICRKDLLNFLFYRLRCRETAEDIVQESFLILARIGNTAQIESPRSFLFTTASNLAVDYIRHNQVVLRYLEQQLQLVVEAEPDSLAKQLSEAEWQAMLKQALKELPSRTRDVFVLNRLHGYSYKQVAELLAVSESSVEKHISRALLHCRASLGPHFLHSSH